MSIKACRRRRVAALTIPIVVLGGIIVGVLLTDTGALCVLGHATTNWGYYDISERLFRRAIRFDASNCVARLGLAWTLHVRGHANEAFAELEAAERIAVGPVRDMARDTRMVMEHDLVNSGSPPIENSTWP